MVVGEPVWREGLGWSLGLQIKDKASGKRYCIKSLWLYVTSFSASLQCFLCSFPSSPFEVQVGPEAGMQKVVHGDLASWRDCWAVSRLCGGVHWF